MEKNVHRPRAPGFAYGGLSILMMLALAVFGLAVTQPPPPTIAEYAPQALEQIEDAPIEQTSRLGAEGAAGAMEPTPTPIPAMDAQDEQSRTIDVARVRRCVGDPPRQIEDPQSPPCVPHWEGDNGGATSKGVTRDEIRIAVANYINAPVHSLARFFNQRFEFYGRKINILEYEAAPRNASPAQMQADAQKVAEELDAFAAFYYTEQDGHEYIYFDELARRGVLSVMLPNVLAVPYADEAHLARHAPYQWNYLPSIDVILANYAEFMCGTLAGKPPVYAGLAIRTEPERIFGLLKVRDIRGLPPIDLTPLTDGLARCGVEPVVEEFETDNTESAQTAMLQMMDQGVTSILVAGPRAQLSVQAMQAASRQGYHPEWLVSDIGGQVDDVAAQFIPPDHADHVIGATAYNKLLPLEDLPSTWALQEVNEPSVSHSWSWPYWNLLTLASGIQMAGPELTPATFESGLLRTQFPNPGAGSAPYYQGTVGFPDHTMIQDLAMVWLSQTESSPFSGKAPRYCFVGRGVRYGQGEWPQEDPRFREGPCV